MATPTLKKAGLIALSVVLGIACALLLRSYQLQLIDYMRQLNDPWKVEAPAYARLGYNGKQRIFTTLTPAQLSRTLEQLPPDRAKHWLRSQPAKWIAIGGKIEQVGQTTDVERSQTRVVLEQSKGNTELFFPLAAYTRLPKQRGTKLNAVCHIYGVESDALILDDCWQISP